MVVKPEENPKGNPEGLRVVLSHMVVKLRTNWKENGMKEKKTEFIAVKVTPSFKARAKALATEEGRSLSNYIEWLINNDMKRREQEEQE